MNVKLLNEVNKYFDLISISIFPDNSIKYDYVDLLFLNVKPKSNFINKTITIGNKKYYCFNDNMQIKIHSFKGCNTSYPRTRDSYVKKMINFYCKKLNVKFEEKPFLFS